MHSIKYIIKNSDRPNLQKLDKLTLVQNVLCIYVKQIHCMLS
jgi:hypothetical protein